MSCFFLFFSFSVKKGETTILIYCVHDTDVIRLHSLNHDILQIGLSPVPENAPSATNIEVTKSSDDADTAGTRASGKAQITQMGNTENESFKEKSDRSYKVQESIPLHEVVSRARDDPVHSEQKSDGQEEESLVHLGGNSIKGHTEASEGDENTNENKEIRAFSNTGTTNTEQETNNYTKSEGDNHNPDRSKDEGTVDLCAISEIYQTLTIILTEKLKANATYRLIIKSTGSINDISSRGFYSAPYQEGQEKK